MSEKLISGLVYSEFDEIRGPIARISTPSNLGKELLSLIANKSINMLSDDEIVKSSSLAVIPFPLKNLKGLVKCFDWEDDEARGGSRVGSLTILFNEADDLIFLKYIRDLETAFDDSLTQLIELNTRKEENDEDYSKIITQFHNKTVKTLDELSAQEMGMIDKAEAFPAKESKEPITEFNFKVVICGDPACGKTSTVLRFTNNAFKRTYLPTVGVNITEKIVNFENDKVKFVLWDIAGQSKFQMMRKHFYLGTHAIVILFDLTRPQTFDTVKDWYDDVTGSVNMDENPPVILCGNKCDLKDERQVSKETAKELAKNLNIRYMETSALTGENITETFDELGRKLIDTWKK